MMGSSSKHHLKQLLNQDQDPFVLENYIDDKRFQLNKPPRRTKTPISQNSTFSCKSSCFCSTHQSSPDIRNSPLYSRNSNTTFFVHIPAKTAALLLEAALRIQNQSPENPKLSPSSSSKNLGFGLFGSILKRVKRSKKKKDNLNWESSNDAIVGEEEKTNTLGLEEKPSSSCNSRVSSAWSEKSIDLETSTTRSEASQETESSSLVQQDFLHLSDKGTPFRFPLSPILRSPELLSPATSPNRRKNQAEKRAEEGHLDLDGKQGKEEKEHCSPVSVLDVQIEEDVEGSYEDEQEEEDNIQLERSFAKVEKARQKLMQKLRRFERLAELDPLELEKRIAEDGDEDEDEDEDEGESDEESEKCDVLRIGDVLKGTGSSNLKRIPLDMKRLVIDLMGDEGKLFGSRDRILGADKPCKRMRSLKNVERNTINVMVEMEFRRECNEWQKESEDIEDTVVAVELAIFDFLLEELSMELIELRPFNLIFNQFC